MAEERKKIWIDVFQTGMLRRTFFYWLFYTLSLWNLLFIWWLLREGPGDPIQQYVDFFLHSYPALVVCAAVFPVLAFDAITFSHKLVGPLHRFRKTIQALADGEAVRPIKLREGDFLVDMRDDFNRMLETLQRHGVPVLKPAGADEEEPQQRQPA